MTSTVCNVAEFSFLTRLVRISPEVLLPVTAGYVRLLCPPPGWYVSECQPQIYHVRKPGPARWRHQHSTFSFQILTCVPFIVFPCLSRQHATRAVDRASLSNVMLYQPPPQAPRMLPVLFVPNNHTRMTSVLQVRMVGWLFRAHGQLCASHPWEVIVTTFTLTICMLTMDQGRASPPPDLSKDCGWGQNCIGQEVQCRFSDSFSNFLAVQKFSQAEVTYLIHFWYMKLFLNLDLLEVVMLHCMSCCIEKLFSCVIDEQREVSRYSLEYDY